MHKFCACSILIHFFRDTYSPNLGEGSIKDLSLKGFLWDMNNKKWYNGFYIEFRQSFAKETLSYDEYLKS